VRSTAPWGTLQPAGGYLLPILRWRVVALLRWRGVNQWPPFSALTSLLNWQYGPSTHLSAAEAAGLVSPGKLGLLLGLALDGHWPVLWHACFPLLLLLLGAAALASDSPWWSRCRVPADEFAGMVGKTASNNFFRINVWMAVLQMFRSRPAGQSARGTTPST